MKAAHQSGGEGEAPKRPAASGATLWSFEVVQSAGPKGAHPDGHQAVHGYEVDGRPAAVWTWSDLD